MPPDSLETKEKKSEAAKLRAMAQDMGALTRGKILKPKMSCVCCKQSMYEKKFVDHISRGKCWK